MIVLTVERVSDNALWFAHTDLNRQKYGQIGCVKDAGLRRIVRLIW